MRTFLGFGQVSFIGAPSSLPIKLAGIAGTVIPLLFQWLSYGASTARPNINVLVDMDTTACKAVDQIRSVYIDNLGSDNPVYVYFPDTSYTIVAKPNSEGWYPALTQQKKIWVVGEGFLTGDIPQTFILISNIPMQASVNDEIDNAVALHRASPIITRGNSIYNASLGIPALGDQFFSSGQLLLSTVVPVGMWNTPYPSGFLYVTSLSVNMFGVSGAPGNGRFVIESTGVAGTLIDLGFSIPAAVNSPSDAILREPSLQLKLDATQTWRMRMTALVASGAMQAISSFTQQP